MHSGIVLSVKCTCTRLSSETARMLPWCFSVVCGWVWSWLCVCLQWSGQKWWARNSWTTVRSEPCATRSNRWRWADANTRRHTELMLMKHMIIQQQWRLNLCSRLNTGPCQTTKTKHRRCLSCELQRVYSQTSCMSHGTESKQRFI